MNPALAAAPVGPVRALGEWRRERTLDLALRDLLAARGASALPAGEADSLEQAATNAVQRGTGLAATVLGRLADGRYELAVAGARVQLAAGQSLEAGETVQLRLHSGRAAAGASAAYAAAASPHLLGAAGAEQADQAELGAAARLITRLLASPTVQSAHSAESTHSAHSAHSARTAAPLAMHAGDAPALSIGLHRAMRASGLFYESHLADWIAGRTSAAELAREPQASLPREAQGAAQATGETADAGAESGLRLTPLAESLVQRQLHALERHEALWQGQLWPGQGAELSISEDDPGTRRDQDDARWQAGLKLALPGLGEVGAQLGLAGRRIRLELLTADAAVARRLLEERRDLAEALAAHGLQLASLHARPGHVRTAAAGAAHG